MKNSTDKLTDKEYDKLYRTDPEDYRDNREEYEEEFKAGDTVRTVDGIDTVLSVEPLRIATYNHPNTWYHPTKIIKLYWSETLEKYVTIPE